MTTCDKCGKKYVSSKMFEEHSKTHEVPVEAPVEVKEETPIVVAEQSITLEFSRPVEIYINSIPYLGKKIFAPNMSIASEIVRIAREAYGRDIMMR